MSIPRRDGLNIVPFIDIMLVLLAIVLSVSTFIAQGHIKVNLPSSSSSQNPQEDKKVTIKVDSESKIYLDDIAISEDELEKKIAAAKARRQALLPWCKIQALVLNAEIKFKG